MYMCSTNRLYETLNWNLTETVSWIINPYPRKAQGACDGPMLSSRDDIGDDKETEMEMEEAQEQAHQLR